MNHDEVVGYIAQLFKERGDSQYGGEMVTQLEHALQAATLAEHDGCDSAAISAALLHDIGHVMHDLSDDAPEQGVDDLHEVIAYRFLNQYFPREVSEPVELHVAAKRYLCAVDATYYDSLSEPSKLSLKLQGGPFQPEQIAEFEQHSYWEQAINLRKWDDLAKVAGTKTPSLEYFLVYISQSLLSQSASESQA
jgi:phosphonate degradation associated HDIG domain protein